MYSYLGLFASLLGFGISLYMFVTMQSKKKLVCPRDHPCDRVVSSRYGRTLGVPNTLLGMLYYILAGTGFALITFFPESVTNQFLLALSILTTLGMLFSAYLVLLQAFVIRAWCLWCLGSTLAAILLVVATSGLIR